MNAFVRTSVITFVFGLMTICLFSFRFAISPSVILEMIRRDEGIQALRQAAYRRQVARKQAVQEYITRHCTFAETMQRFQELEQELAEEWDSEATSFRTYVRSISSASDEERLYQVIFYYTKLVLLHRPADSATVLRRLDKDYELFLAGKQKLSTETTRQIARGR